MTLVTFRRLLGRTLAFVLLVVVASSTATWSTAITSSASAPRSRVGECIQGQLQAAVEQRVGFGVAQNPLGYTFLLVNISARSCELRGYPYEFIFSTATGTTARVAMSHARTALYAQPTAQFVVLRPGAVASFGLSYEGINVPPPGEPTNCLATILDFRLPARASSLFSYEFLIRPIEICGATLHAQVTPVEGRTTPLV